MVSWPRVQALRNGQPGIDGFSERRLRPTAARRIRRSGCRRLSPRGVRLDPLPESQGSRTKIRNGFLTPGKRPVLGVFPPARPSAVPPERVRRVPRSAPSDRPARSPAARPTDGPRPSARPAPPVKARPARRPGPPGPRRPRPASSPRIRYPIGERYLETRAERRTIAAGSAWQGHRPPATSRG